MEKMKVDGYDAVIIGGGISGLMASIWLTTKGRHVAVVSKGDPMCCLSTGCIDVLGHTDSPLKDIRKLPSSHPYRMIGQDTIKEALAFFKEVMEGIGLHYTGDPSRNAEILTPVGTTKTTCLVPSTMRIMSNLEDEYLHVVSFKGLKDFYPSYIISRNKNANFSIFDMGVYNTMGLAHAFEEKAFLGRFIRRIRELEISDARIAVPAVLGLRSPERIMEEIRLETEKDIFEIPTLPPSIPGLRLFRGLKQALLEKGGQIYWGKEIASVEKTGNKVEAITLAGEGKPTRVHGKTFLLSTGSFISGGLYATRESKAYETVFDLPVYMPDKRHKWFNDDFFKTGHPIERAGILVRESFRPKDNDIDNLFVSGSILAFSEIMKYQCGHGLAISTGVAAAKQMDGFLK